MSKDTPANDVASRLGKELAFPTTEYVFYNGVPEIGNQHFGLTKREVIAKDALMGILTAGTGVRLNGRTSTDPKHVARLACMLADALLAELSKPQGDETK